MMYQAHIPHITHNMTDRCTTIHTDTWRGIHITKYAYDIPHTSHHIICTDTSHTYIHHTETHYTEIERHIHQIHVYHTNSTILHTYKHMTHVTHRDTYEHHSIYQLSNTPFVHTHIQLQIYHTTTHTYHTQHTTHMHVPCKSRVRSQSQDRRCCKSAPVTMAPHHVASELPLLSAKVLETRFSKDLGSTSDADFGFAVHFTFSTGAALILDLCLGFVSSRKPLIKASLKADGPPHPILNTVVFVETSSLEVNL